MKQRREHEHALFFVCRSERREMMTLRRGSGFAAALCAAAFIMAALTGQSYAAEKKIHTYYTGLDVAGTGLSGYEIRYRVRSYYLGDEVKYSKKREIGAIRNYTDRPATKSLSISKSTTRTYSISASTIIPKRVLQNDINATIGGSLSFNNTISISASAEVPAHQEKSVYLQYKYSRSRYKYVVQRQVRKLFGKWKNSGKLSIRHNTSTTKVPVLVL